MCRIHGEEGIEGREWWWWLKCELVASLQREGARAAALAMSAIGSSNPASPLSPRCKAPSPGQ